MQWVHGYSSEYLTWDASADERHCIPPDSTFPPNSISYAPFHCREPASVTATPFPLEPTPTEAQIAIREEFAFFGDWSERYQYLIDLGRKLPAFPDTWKTEEHRLHGCQSMVWIVPEGDAARLDFHAISDSAIVSGLVYLALRVYSGRSAAEIVATDADYIADIGLAKHLSPTRSNGLAALLNFIREYARRLL